MPSPDPFALTYYETPDGRHGITAEVGPTSGPFATGNRRHRLARMTAVLRNLTANGWTCPECGDPVPTWRRADAVYCREGCRKRAKRRRREGLMRQERECGYSYFTRRLLGATLPSIER